MSYFLKCLGEYSSRLRAYVNEIDDDLVTIPKEYNLLSLDFHKYQGEHEKAINHYAPYTRLLYFMGMCSAKKKELLEVLKEIDRFVEVYSPPDPSKVELQPKEEIDLLKDLQKLILHGTFIDISTFIQPKYCKPLYDNEETRSLLEDIKRDIENPESLRKHLPRIWRYIPGMALFSYDEKKMLEKLVDYKTLDDKTYNSLYKQVISMRFPGYKSKFNELKSSNKPKEVARIASSLLGLDGGATILNYSGKRIDRDRIFGKRSYKLDDDKATPLTSQVGGNHYKELAIQPVEFCHKNKLGPCESAVVKYVSRWKSKNGIQDLKKAIHYLELLIEMESKDEKQSS